MDPTNPRILFAAMWRYRRLPWGLDAGGGLTSSDLKSLPYENVRRPIYPLDLD